MFDLVERIDVITLTGGEAILHRNIVDLCEFLLERQEKFGRLDFQTNGTVLFSDELLSVMAKSSKLTFFIDNYGPNISTNVERNVERCKQRGVRYQVRKYYGEDAHIYGNLLTVCAMPYCRYSIGAQPLEDILTLDLTDERLALEEKRERLLEMRDTEFNPGCQYCCGIGVDQDVKRYPAGEQVERT